MTRIETEEAVTVHTGLAATEAEAIAAAAAAVPRGMETDANLIVSSGLRRRRNLPARASRLLMLAIVVILQVVSVTAIDPVETDMVDVKRIENGTVTGLEKAVVVKGTESRIDGIEIGSRNGSAVKTVIESESVSVIENVIAEGNENAIVVMVVKESASAVVTALNLPTPKSAPLSPKRVG